MYIAEHRKLVIVPRNVHTVSRISSYNTSKIPRYASLFCFDVGKNKSAFVV